jgi:hypothetical protein
MSVTRPHALTLPIVIVLAISGCGGGAKSPRVTVGSRCPPVARPAIATGGLRSIALTKAFELRLRRLSGVDTSVRVRVMSSRMLGPIPAYFSKRTPRPSFAASGGRFLAVRYTVTNVGTASTESASTINNLFNVAGTSRRPSYGRADVGSACPTVSPSVAKLFHVASPETKLQPGAQYTTVAVYVVPRGLGALRWASVGARREVELGRGT